MPPGYYVVAGGWLGLGGPSLATARWLSWRCTALSYLGLVIFCAGYGLRLAATILLAAFTLGTAFVASGNVARMDALLLLMVVAGFLLLQRGRALGAFACLTLGLLVHPNAGYFLLGAAVYWRAAAGISATAPP